jgi:PAS domain S-box-containing protein
MINDIKILLIDECPGDRKRAARALKRAFSRANIVQVKDGSEQFHEILKEQCFDLVVSESRLSWSCGQEVLEAVRSRWPGCAVIFYTAPENESAAIEAMHAGLDHYVLKSPRENGSLAAAARSAIWRARTRSPERDLVRTYNSMFSIARVGLYRTTAQGQLIDANDALLEILGYEDLESLKNSSTLNLYANPADRAVWKDQVLQSGWRRGFETRLQRKDGKIIWVRDSSRAVYDAGGNLLFFEGLLEDITALKEARDALVESERRLASVISNLPGAVYRCKNDRQWSMEYISEGFFELTQYHPEALLDHPELTYADLIHDDDRERVWEDIQRALKSGSSYQVEYRIHTADGHEKWVWEQGRGVFDESGNLLALEGMITDITQRVKAKQKIQQQYHRLAALRKIDLSITTNRDLSAVLEVFIDQVINELQVDACAVLLVDRARGWLELAAERGFRSPDVRKAAMPVGKGLSGLVAYESRELCIYNLSAFRKNSAGGDRDILNRLGYFPWFLNEGFEALIIVPLVTKDEVKGVLGVFNRTPLKQDPEWKEFLDALAGQAAIAIENAQLFESLQRYSRELATAYDETLVGWSRALELRDQETEGHSRRVTEMTLELAKAMGVSGEDLVHLYRGTLLHDIGKMGVPDNILLKPGKLTDEEWEIMRRHPDYAYKMLAGIPFLQKALDVPYCHHEKWDGSGYPRGLKGEEIPLSARIFAVIDVWDALCSDRPYRPAWSSEEALQYILDESGKHFDPAVVQAFVKLLHNGKLS